MDRWFSRIASPVGVVGTLVALAAAWGLWLSGDVTDGRLVRFTGLGVVLTSVMAWIRFSVHAARRESVLPGWRWAMRTLPLPYFDEEFASGHTPNPGAKVPVLAAALLFLGTAGLGGVSVAAGLQERAVGALDISPGESAQAWQQSAPLRMARDLGFAARLERVDAMEQVANLAFSMVGSEWQRGVSLSPRVPVLAGEHVLSWDGVAVSDRVGGASFSVAVEERAPIEVSLNVGETVSLGEGGGQLSLMAVDENRLGTLGPAVRIHVTREGEHEVLWLHARAPDFHAERSDSSTKITLVALHPHLSARFVLRSAGSPALVWWGLGFGVLLLLGLGILSALPVWLRGRSGDYEAAWFGRSSRGEQVAKQMLSEDAFAEWRSISQEHGSAGR